MSVCKVVIGSLFLMLSLAVPPAIGGEVPSPLDQSPERIKEIIDTDRMCVWDTLYSAHRCLNPYPKHRVISTDKDGRVEYVSIIAHLGAPGAGDSFHVRRESIAEQAAVTEAVARLFPNWSGSRAWMARMFKQATAHRYGGGIRSGYMAHIRVEDTSIYVATAWGGRPDALRAEIEITREKKPWDERADVIY